MVAIVITNKTAPLIPTEVETFPETPRKGQIPRNCANTILLTNIDPIIITKYSMINYLSGFFNFVNKSNQIA